MRDGPRRQVIECDRGLSGGSAVYKKTEAARRDHTAAQAEHFNVVYEEEEVGAFRQYPKAVLGQRARDGGIGVRGRDEIEGLAIENAGDTRLAIASENETKVV